MFGKNLKLKDMEEINNNLPKDEILKIIKRQNIHLARISQNSQFFFGFL